MIIRDINLSSFRNFKQSQLTVGSSVNLFIGDNGSGKTSLLEALYLFGFGRSFRTNKLSHSVNHSADSFTVFIRAIKDDEGDGEYRFGMSRNREGVTQLKLNGELKQRLSEIAQYFPIQLFTPQSSDVITGAPSDRRQFIDWGLFHVEQSFLEASVKYKQALKQRNALLKSRSQYSRTQDEYWCQILAECGEQIDSIRRSYVERLLPVAQKSLNHFLPGVELELSYHSGWNNDQDLLMTLQSHVDRDRIKGYSSYGPHKADLKIKVDGYSASEQLSRGQLRVLMASLQLAQTQQLKQQQNRQSIFLLDDVGAELDAIKRSTFIELLLNCDAQVFVTAIDKQQFNMPPNCTDLKVFHVEHGTVIQE